jgi:hypothetical protein
MIKGGIYNIMDTIGIPEGSSDEIWNKLEKVEEKANTESSIKAYIFVLGEHLKSILCMIFFLD